MSTTNTTKEERTARAQIVRLYEASCEIGQPDAEEMRFRQTLQFASLRRAPVPGVSEPDEDALRERAHLVRLYEANCRIKFPKDDDAAFRRQLHRDIGAAFDLAALRKHIEEGAARRGDAARKANETRKGK